MVLSVWAVSPTACQVSLLDGLGEACLPNGAQACNGAGQDEIKLKQELADPLNDLQETAEKIAQISAECKLEVDAQEYMESFKPTLMDIVDKWSKVRPIKAGDASTLLKATWLQSQSWPQCDHRSGAACKFVCLLLILLLIPKHGLAGIFTVTWAAADRVLDSCECLGSMSLRKRS